MIPPEWVGVFACLLEMYEIIQQINSINEKCVNKLIWIGPSPLDEN